MMGSSRHLGKQLHEGSSKNNMRIAVSMDVRVQVLTYES